MESRNFDIIEGGEYAKASAMLATSRGVALNEWSVQMQDHDTPNNNLIPYGYCHCGCGERTTILTFSHSKLGLVKGEPRRFIKGHHQRVERRQVTPSEIRVDASSNTAHVKLSQGRWATIDLDDLERVRDMRWFAYKSGHGNTFYARSNGRDSAGKPVAIHMHRLIMGDPHGMQVDHIDGDGLNNRRTNLRTATNQQNSWNDGKRSTNKSGYKGVSWKSRNKKWVAQIGAGGVKRHLGLFSSATEAARAYDAAAREEFGEFARLNFPLEDTTGKTGLK